MQSIIVFFCSANVIETVTMSYGHLLCQFLIRRYAEIIQVVFSPACSK